MNRFFQNKMQEKKNAFTKAAIVHLFIPTMLVGQLIVLLISKDGRYFPEQDALMQVIGSCAQIIAGLYGITLAGYTFFLSRIDGLMATDDTLRYIVNSIKQRYKYLIYYITGNVGATLIISVYLMYYPADRNLIPEYLYRVICNEFVLFLLFSTALILYYSVSVVNPNAIENEARKLKFRISRGQGKSGSVTEFVDLYDRIEACCRAMIPENVWNQLETNKGNRFDFTLELIQEKHPQIRMIAWELVRLHQYYCCVVNCKTISVSQEMCLQAQHLLAALEKVSG